MSNPSSNRVLRPLGAFERTIDLYTHRNPVQFSLALRLARGVSEGELRAAFGRLQEVHPLLAVDITQPAAASGAQDTAAFRRCDGPIHVRTSHGSTWQQEAAFEQTTRIHPTPGPLVRCVLIPAEDSTAEAMILATFAHQIADGRGALQAAHDLARILEGKILSAGTMPESQEDLLANDATPPAPVSVDASPAEPPADTDPAPTGTLRPFDAALPILQTAELTAEATRSLVQRAREESCTVQAALCAAAATACSLGRIEPASGSTSRSISEPKSGTLAMWRSDSAERP